MNQFELIGYTNDILFTELTIKQQDKISACSLGFCSFRPISPFLNLIEEVGYNSSCFTAL